MLAQWCWSKVSVIQLAVQALKMFLQDSAKAALHSLHCQPALWRGWGSGARGLWKSPAEGGYNETSLKAKLWPTQITQVRLMKDEGGRLRGYGYADFEDRDSLVSFNYVGLLLLQLRSQTINQIDVLSMTDLAVNNRKMRIDLASQVFRRWNWERKVFLSLIAFYLFILGWKGIRRRRRLWWQGRSRKKRRRSWRWQVEITCDLNHTFLI